MIAPPNPATARGLIERERRTTVLSPQAQVADDMRTLSVTRVPLKVPIPGDWYKFQM
jgi:hypothetical protein